MQLKLKCPTCGREGTVPNAALNRTVQCLSCESTYAIRDAVQHSSQSAPAAGDADPPNEKMLLGFAFGVPGALLLVFLTYWFGIRDTWEIDNHSQIIQRCEAVLLAIRQADDPAAAEGYRELEAFIGQRAIKREWLAKHVEDVRENMVAVNQRLEEARREREARALAEKRQREALAEAEKREQAAEAEARRPRERYYRDSHGAIVSESETEATLSRLRSMIWSMPNDARRAYLEGKLSVAEKEWARIKAQGPIDR